MYEMRSKRVITALLASSLGNRHRKCCGGLSTAVERIVHCSVWIIYLFIYSVHQPAVT